ncbi:MAG: HAD hydrolase-like protein [Legionellales bacterium]|nr:HAD hydrolase-like protein [Legionellales bacterium]
MHILFDFDGTLVNSFPCVLKKAILLAEEFSFRKVQEEEIERLRDLSSKEIIKFLNIPIYKIPLLISRMRKHLQSEMKTLKPIPGIQAMLEQLYDEKFIIGILTSNSIENVESWLNLHNMRHLFSFIHSESSYFSKKYLIKRTLSKYRIDRSQAIYIGDETRDIDAANKNNMISIAVTWGYNSEKAMLKYKPSFVAESPKDILCCARSHVC